MKWNPPASDYIHMVGVELEGGWLPSRGIHPYGDGSVTVSGRHDDDYDECSDPECSRCFGGPGRSCDSRLRVGEICSEPLPVSEIIPWMLDNYPDAMNASCGLHVHVSFKSMLRYSQLMDKKFWRYFQVNYEKWALGKIRKDSAFWRRWRGDNDYCRREWDADGQASMTHKGGNRYTQLNYCHAVRDGAADLPRGTVECRVLPMFQDKTVAAAAVSKLISVYDKYLSKQPIIEPEVAHDVLVDPLEVREEEIECA